MKWLSEQMATLPPGRRVDKRRIARHDRMYEDVFAAVPHFIDEENITSMYYAGLADSQTAELISKARQMAMSAMQSAQMASMRRRVREEVIAIDPDLDPGVGDWAGSGGESEDNREESGGSEVEIVEELDEDEELESEVTLGAQDDDDDDESEEMDVDEYYSEEEALE